MSRGSRGVKYGAPHERARRRVARTVAAGAATCARCGEPIRAGQRWHLDHNDSGTGYLGPSHATCNERAGGAKGRAAQTGRDPDPRPFDWSRW